MQKYKKYLPSKKFIKIMSFSVVGIIIIFLIFFFISKKENFTAKKENNNALKVGNQTINDLVKNDSDGDGIADWEEALWGTDPTKKITFNDTLDTVYIENRKKELNIAQVNENENLTETDKFAREFFATFTAMKQSGQVDSNTINSFSNALGQKIINPSFSPRFSEMDVKINNTDNVTERQKYYTAMQKLFRKYQSSSGLGDELDIVSGNLASSSTIETTELITIANGYQNFANEIMGIFVPKGLIQYHLQIANSANNTGISIKNMTKITTDPIVGVSGLSQYQKYSDELVTAVANLEAILPG